ncbi:CMP-sialic acid transporter 1, partial [Cucurbita argyrosperma subsp. argyrosperma]
MVAAGITYIRKMQSFETLGSDAMISQFGSIFNMARLVVDDFRGGFENGPWWQRIFNGYSITTWMVVINLGSTGLLVSWLMKYADNIVKVYSTSMAMLLTTVLSVHLFNFRPTLQLFLGIIVCMMSLHMYFAPPQMLVDLPSPSLKSDPESLAESSSDRRSDS